MNIIRLDLVFSYWILFWFVLYSIKVVSFSPKLAIIIGLFDNILSAIYLVVKNAPPINIIKYLCINTLIKAIPLFFLWRDKIILPRDVIIIVLFFLLYLGWLYINRTNVYSIYRELIQHYINQKTGKQTIVGYYFYKGIEN